MHITRQFKLSSIFDKLIYRDLYITLIKFKKGIVKC